MTKSVLSRIPRYANHAFHFAQTDANIEVQPDTLRDDLLWRSVTPIKLGRHLSSITSCQCDSSLQNGGQLSMLRASGNFSGPNQPDSYQQNGSGLGNSGVD